MKIKALKRKHYAEVDAIYREGIATGQATFETAGKRWKEWKRGHLKSCRLIAEEGRHILGWAALSPVSGRCVYGGVAEASIYLTAAARGQGVGTALLHALIRESEKAGLWTLQAGIFPENKASIALFQKGGFRIVGHRERIGRMHTGEWRDTLLLERRSTINGA